MKNLLKFVPNLLTLSRCITTVVIVYMRYAGWYQSILPLVIFGLLTDFLDGFIARKYKLSTQFGKQFDHYADKFFIISLFFLMGIELFPYKGSYAVSVFLCLVLLVVRDVAIGRFKVKHKNLPVLLLAKRKTTLQGGGLIAYFAGWPILTLILMLAATVSSLVSAYGYRLAARGGRGGINATKIKSTMALLSGKKKVDAQFDSFPPVGTLREMFGEKLQSIIVDLDGTVSPFDRQVSEKMYSLLTEYETAGISLVIYSNTSDTKRLDQIKQRGLSVYTGNFSKPQRGGYEQLAGEFLIKLDTAVMIGDSPITDIPYPSASFLAGVVLVRPIRPEGGIKARLHYFMNRFLIRFVLLKDQGDGKLL